jgi:hypothetical protein
MESEGPEQFGRVMAIEVDGDGRIYVLDAQAHEIRIFAPDGRHVRSVSREGGGPGELRRPMTMLFDPEGHLRVLDPQNNRISVFDTSGAFLDSHYMPGSFFTSSWPGGYDSTGSFYSFLPIIGKEAFRFDLVRYDRDLNPVDTVDIPRYEGETFDYTSPDGNNQMQTGVPFAPYLVWLFDRKGTIWEGINAEYRMVQRTMGGDTLRVIERDYTPVPVTSADRDSAVAGLKWFTDQGGKIDPSRVPGRKPAYVGFLLDRVGDLWVLPFAAAAEQNRLVDVFDPRGRYLGRLTLPFEIQTSPRPIITDRHVYAVTEDELGVQYVVRGRIEKPPTD